MAAPLDLDYATATLRVQLLHAAEAGDLRLFKKTARTLDGGNGRLREAVEGATASGCGAGALHVAASHGTIPVCAYLVEDLHFNVDAVDDNGIDRLVHACFQSRKNACVNCYWNCDTVRYLLDHGANPDKPAGDLSPNPLHIAVGQGYCEIVKVLLRKELMSIFVPTRGTPLYNAALLGFDDIMKLLLDNHADCNKAVCIANTPLIIALRAHKQNCVKLLIKAGADLKGVGSAEPLIVAITEGLTECLKWLIEAGADPNVLDDFGRLPIEVAASHNSRACVKILFPLSSRIPSVRNWSINGIIAYVKSTEEALSYYGEDKTLISNRSLCWLKMGEGDKALRDAQVCRAHRPDWPKACFREGSAHMLLKDYEKARDAFVDGLKLDPENTEIENAISEALHCLEISQDAKKDH